MNYEFNYEPSPDRVKFFQKEQGLHINDARRAARIEDLRQRLTTQHKLGTFDALTVFSALEDLLAILEKP